MELIDVILPIYKEDVNIVEEAVCSILNQTYTNFHLIIIIDDPENEEVINYIHSLKDSRIEIVKNEVNIGLVNSLNKALNYCRGEYIARMDADDISLVNRLEEQLNYLKKNNLDFIGSNILQFDEKREYFRSNIPIQNNDIKNKIKYTNCFYHPTFLFKKNVLDSVKCYRNIKYCEDYDFVIRVIYSGKIVGNCPQTLLKYRVNLNGISQLNSAAQRINSLYIQKKYKKFKEIDLLEFGEYETSKTYKNKLENLKKYYCFKNRIKKVNFIKKIYLLFICFIINPLIFLKDVRINRIINKQVEK